MVKATTINGAAIIKQCFMSTILKEEDKFSGKTFFKLNHKWVLRNDDDLNEINMHIEFLDIKVLNKTVQSVQPTEKDAGGENYTFEPTVSVVRILVELQSKNWWFLNHGKLIFLADNNVIDLGKPVGRNTGTGTVKVNNKETHVVCNEHCVYLITKEDLKKICDAQKVEVQLSGEKWKQENSFDKINTDYFRLFYNQVIDSNSFGHVVHNVNSFEKDMKTAQITGIGVGCVVPFILFMIVAFTYVYKEDGMGWTMGAPFIIAVGGGVAYFILQSRAKKKANS